MHDHPDRVEAAVKDGADAHDELDRRRFLQRATILVGGVMATSVAIPAATMAVAPAFHTGTYYDVDLGPATSFPVDAANPYHIVTFESAPHDTTGIGRRIAFVRNDGDNSFTALSNTCMHVGCPVRNFGCGLRLSVPRRPVRRRGTADRRATRAPAQPVRDPGRHTWPPHPSAASTPSTCSFAATRSSPRENRWTAPRQSSTRLPRRDER